MDIDEICNLKEDVTNPRLSTSLGVHGFGSCLYVGTVRIPGRIVSTFSGLFYINCGVLICNQAFLSYSTVACAQVESSMGARADVKLMELLGQA